MNEIDFTTFSRACQAQVENTLKHYLPSENTSPTTLHQAMRYSTLSGGKRIRPLLVYASGEILDVENKTLHLIAAAVECIHSYSLVHDDLPAMDNDDLRRGQPTCHRQFDEATAILAGDALQTFAFYLISHHLKTVSAETKLKLIDCLACATGSRGMAGGQSIDLASTGKTLTLPELENMHIHKTGALIRASVMLPAYCASVVSDLQLEKLDSFAKSVGLAFQIHDDILDIESSTNVLGKTSRKDISQNKSTYPSVLGFKESKEKREHLFHQAIDSLSIFQEKSQHLQAIAKYIIQRER